MTPDQIFAIAGSIFGGLAVGLQIGDLRGQRRAERQSDCERIQRLSAEYLSAVANLQGSAAGHRQAWDSPTSKAITLLHAAASFIGQRDLLRGLSAAAPIAYAFHTGTWHSATLLTGPVARMGTAWAQIRQEDDERLVAAADILYEVAGEVAARPRSDRGRLDVAMKAFGDEARRAAHEARLTRWRVWLANRLLRKRRK